MRTAAPLLAACALAAQACVSAKPELLAVDPARRGFELPARPIVLFYVDGLRADVLEELRAEGELPRLERLFFGRAARARSAVACVPSVTYANAVTMLTGCWPSTHGVGSNACFDRLQLVTRDYETQREHAGGDRARPSIFELLPDELTAGVALPFERGVKISRAKSARTGGAAFGVAWVAGREREADELVSAQLHDVAEQARRIGEWPAFVAVHLPGVDDVGHEHGSDGEEYRAAVRGLDESIGGVLEAFERGGMLESLTVVLTSDHGHHSAPRSAELARLLDEALGVPVLVAKENDGDAPYVERFERYAPARAVAVSCGARVASVHLRAGKRWCERPALEELLTFPAALGAPAESSLPDRLLRSPAVALVALRAGEHSVRVHGRGGAASIEREGGDGEPRFRYEVLEGEDPLGYSADERLREWMRSPRASGEWLAATADLRHPDIVPQLALALGDPRGGDLVLFAAPGWDFAADDYVGGHGGIEREEMVVPLYLAGPGLRPGAEAPAARLVDLVPTLLELADARPAGEPSFDGKSFADLLR